MELTRLQESKVYSYLGMEIIDTPFYSAILLEAFQKYSLAPPTICQHITAILHSNMYNNGNMTLHCLFYISIKYSKTRRQANVISCGDIYLIAAIHFVPDSFCWAPQEVLNGPWIMGIGRSKPGRPTFAQCTFCEHLRTTCTEALVTDLMYAFGLQDLKQEKEESLYLLVFVWSPRSEVQPGYK